MADTKVTVPFRQALAWAFDGTLRDAKTITALLMWERLGRNDE